MKDRCAFIRKAQGTMEEWGRRLYTRNGGTTVRCRFGLKRLDEHTVFEAEVTRIILALDIIQATAGPHITKVTILFDNQAAVTAAEHR